MRRLVKTKTNDLTQKLREFIAQEKYLPGDRLPTVSDLEKRFQVSRTVVQSSIGQLRQEGSIEAIDRQGLFVSERPPHLSKIILGFATPRDDKEWDQFLITFEETLAAFNHRWQGFEIDIRTGIKNVEGPIYTSIIQDVTAGRCAGLITVGMEKTILENQMLINSKVPKAAICPFSHHPAFSSVVTAGDIFWQRAFDCLQGKGAERIAVLDYPQALESTKNHFLKPEFRPRESWILGAFPGCHYANTNLIKLLFDGHKNERPNGLIIGNDNLEVEVLRGLTEAGIMVGRDVHVVSQCNWPMLKSSPLPVIHLGYDVPALLDAAVNAIKWSNANAGKSAERFRVFPSFEEEFIIAEQQRHLTDEFSVNQYHKPISGYPDPQLSAIGG